MEVGESSTSTSGQKKRERGNPFDGITPQAAASSSPVMKKGPWDVFINHRGCDVKDKLASTIYHTLDQLGVHAFLDEKELELGDSITHEIQEAMRTAQLHIAIFSERYAESAWCLAELSFMLETGTPILPVFYHVQPDDLRWVAKGKGAYAPAFSQHQKKRRYPSSRQREWKRALERVSNLSGHVLNSNTGNEGMLLKSIINSVSRVIKKGPLWVAKHPAGMDEIVGDFERRRQEYIESGQQAQIVGIVGLGGSGKTTLATELYNRKSSSFSHSSFLHDVRDAASMKALHTKQKKLLEDLRIQNVESFDHFKVGKGIIAERLKTLDVLIVLDDVNHEDQLDALLPPKESLGSGSLVIVTTRDGDVLTKWGITSIYRMQPLCDLHAKKLFCWHAFVQPSPQEGFDELVESFLKFCSGLPLSLKVIGGQLCGRKSMEYWYALLDKIRKTLPHDIKVTLKVSFDALEPDEKNVFLDIACFFIGEETRLAIPVWDGSRWSGLCSLETLLNRCLAEVDENGRLRMHDHLRDLGREIATTSKPSRFWFQRESMDIQRGLPIRGIVSATAGNVNFNSSYFPPSMKEYMEMMRISNVRDGLQLLDVQGNDFAQEYGELSRGLLWLRWFRFEHRCIPSWLSLENIRVLQLFCSAYKLKTLWEEAHPPPLQLRELLIDNATNLQSLPRSIGQLKHLKRLSLGADGTTPLRSLPEEFCLLRSLEHLELRGCRNLSNLPNHFGDLVNLRHINFECCESLERLPESFQQLIHLEYLNLLACYRLDLESNILKNITSLKVLDFSGCSEVLPRNVTNQASLGVLRLMGSRRLGELPASIGQLSKLKTLYILGCELLKRLPTSLGNLSRLATLTIENCKNLESLPIEGRELCSLQTLSIGRCPQLNEMSSLAGLVSLKNFCVFDCCKIEKIEGLAGLVSLKELLVSECYKIEKIEGLAGLVSLNSLRVRNCHKIEKIESLAGLVSLNSLEVGGNHKIEKIGLAGLVFLNYLSIENCPKIEKIEDLTRLVSLHYLSIEDCPKIEKIDGLEHLASLKELTLWTRWMVPGIHSLGATERLRRVNLNADNISAFEGCIQSIEIEKWPWEMTIRGRIFPRFQSILDSFTFPSLDVVDSYDRVEELWSLTCQEEDLSKAAVLCYVVRTEYWGRRTEQVLLSEEEWIVIKVFREGPLVNNRYVLNEFDSDQFVGAWLMVGERGCVVKGFKQLFQTLCKGVSTG